MTKWLKRIGIAVASLVLLIAVVVAGVYVASSSQFAKKYPSPAPDFATAVSSTPETIERGEHLAGAIGKCMECHGDDLGGKFVINDPAFGRIYATNLTRGKGGVVGQYTDAQLVRAIRYGIGHDDRALLFMPSLEFYHFNDEDLAALVAYIRNVPNVDRPSPGSSPGPVARALHLGGKVPMLVSAAHTTKFAPRKAPVPAGATKEYGAYLAMVGGCVGCHGDKLTGGPIPGAPPEWPKAANITLTAAGIGSWTEADFTRALREGKRPDGRILSAVMPWPYTKRMTDAEIKAVWEYLKSL